MKALCEKVLQALQGKTLVTAESCTGGGIGAALTAVSGSSSVYKGGIICYQNDVKERILQVDRKLLDTEGAVSAPVAKQMAAGVRNVLQADIAVSVTGLAGPGGDEFGHRVGTVFIGYADENGGAVRQFCFSGSREEVRSLAIMNALQMIIDMQTDRV